MTIPVSTDAAVRAVAAARRRETVRARLVSLALFLVLLVVFAFSLAVGDFNVPLGDLPGILVGNGTGAGAYVVTELRLPRAVTGVLAGLGFGVAGALFQRVLRNPLASPDVIGVTQGASAAAVVCIVLFGVSGTVVSFAALAGALLTSAITYGLARGNGSSGYRLVLIGIGVGAVLASVVSYLLTWADVTLAQQALVWLTGDLNGRGWAQAVPLAVALVVLFPLALLLGRALTGLRLGDDTAAGLGLRVERARSGLLLVATACAACATAAAGPIAFVAFVSDPIASRLVGGARAGLVAPALTGAVVTLAGDFAAQHFLGSQLPVGVVTGAIGAPYLLWLLARANRAGRV